VGSGFYKEASPREDFPGALVRCHEMHTVIFSEVSADADVKLWLTP
jgi:hypothetical protein